MEHSGEQQGVGQELLLTEPQLDDLAAAGAAGRHARQQVRHSRERVVEETVRKVAVVRRRGATGAAVSEGREELAARADEGQEEEEEEEPEPRTRTRRTRRTSRSRCNRPLPSVCPARSVDNTCIRRWIALSCPLGQDMHRPEFSMAMKCTPCKPEAPWSVLAGLRSRPRSLGPTPSSQRAALAKPQPAAREPELPPRAVQATMAAVAPEHPAVVQQRGTQLGAFESTPDDLVPPEAAEGEGGAPEEEGMELEESGAPSGRTPARKRSLPAAPTPAGPPRRGGRRRRALFGRRGGVTAERVEEEGEGEERGRVTAERVEEEEEGEEAAAAGVLQQAQPAAEGMEEEGMEEEGGEGMELGAGDSEGDEEQEQEERQAGAVAEGPAGVIRRTLRSATRVLMGVLAAGQPETGATAEEEGEEEEEEAGAGEEEEEEEGEGEAVAVAAAPKAAAAAASAPAGVPAAGLTTHAAARAAPKAGGVRKVAPGAGGRAAEKKGVIHGGRKPAHHESFRRYVFKVLKQVHPELGASAKSMDFMEDMFERIVAEAARLARINNRKTLSAREVQSAVRLVLPGTLAEHAVGEGKKAVMRFSGLQD
eukprot:scaffold3.g6480.t1